ncbi:relaxase/mobilization nuclease domain-containing protein [Polaribacter cellanae]|uniref:Relaxase/mobilization nuclease domain-containing protein n=1 Tax=Polaribacter cellanae TaxID=2818493 RepID=A0A975CKJ3_9FLAO|nr:relaxase/mobilization nuclease domain-containing protein [Polaribacter cellanae]QTE21019.1 relaxase/mobilization nuclease domain-containing protein [Polaribacter cellanae]
MIAKILTGSGKGCLKLLQYITTKDNQVITSNNILPNLKITEVVKEFKKTQSLNNRCTKNLMHIVLSFPKSEKINSFKMKNISEDFIKAFNANDCMSITYQHYDREHPHLHIALNKVKNDGSILSDSFSHLRAREICRKIEQIYDLEQISNYSTKNKNTSIEKIKEDIDAAILASRSFQQFIEIMAIYNYKVLKGRGVSFIYNLSST